MGVALLDSSLHFIPVNGALKNMLGYSSDELLCLAKMKTAAMAMS